jgi:hypothetical protein
LPPLRRVTRSWATYRATTKASVAPKVTPVGFPPEGAEQLTTCHGATVSTDLGTIPPWPSGHASYPDERSRTQTRSVNPATRAVMESLELKKCRLDVDYLPGRSTS